MKSLFFLITWTLLASVAVGQLNTSWLNPEDGSWTDAANWSTDPEAPLGPDDSAKLSVSGSPYTATIAADLSLDQINIDSPDASVLLQGAILSATNGISANQGPLVIKTGTIANTRLAGAVGIQTFHTNSSVYLRDRKLEDVTLATTLTAAPNSTIAPMELSNTLTLEDGEIHLDDRLRLVTQGPLTVAGTGVISVDCCGGSQWYLIGSDTHVLLESGVTLRANESTSLYVNENNWPGGFASFENRGTVEAVGGSIVLESDVAYRSPTGTLRAVDGGSITLRDVNGEIGALEIGTNSSVLLGGEPLLTQPLSVPATGTLSLSANWQSNTTVTVNGGTVRLSSAPISGDWVWQSNSTLDLLDGVVYTTLLDLGLAADTRISFAGGGVSLGNETVDLNAIPGVWDFTLGSLFSGTLSGLPNGGVLEVPTDFLTLSAVTLDTPVQVEAGSLRVINSTIAQPLTLTGGKVELRNSWVNSAGISVEGGRLELKSMPTSLGTITLRDGEVVLPSLPGTPGELQASGGTIELEQVNYVVADLQALPWTPAAYSAGSNAVFDLEGNTFDLSAGAWELGLGGGAIRNGTIENTNAAGPWQVRGGKLQDITLLTDLHSTETVTLDGNITVQNASLAGSLTLSAAASSNILLDSVILDGNIKVGTFNGTPPAIVVRNGLTLNGLMELGTRFLCLEGTQTIDGNGVMDTDGIRGSPGGGIEVVNGSLTLGPDFTFHSRRNGSKIIVNGLSFTNEGTLLVDVNEYGNGADVPEPGLTLDISGFVTSGGDFYQNGLVRVVEGYELRVEAYEIHNTGQIELRGGDLTGSGVELINTGEFRGHGLVVSTGDGLFQNQGTLAVGDTEPFGEQPASEIGLLQIATDFVQDAAGALALDLAGPQPGVNADQLSILGTATLDGLLELTLIDGFTPSLDTAYELLTASGGINGTFDEVVLTTSGIVLDWSLDYGPTSLSVTFEAAAGDLDADGRFTGSDFLAWQRGDSPQPISDSDLANWQSRYGSQSPGPGTINAIPEPGTAGLLLMATLSLAVRAMFNRHP